MAISIALPLIFFAVCSQAAAIQPRDASKPLTRSEYFRGINWKTAESGDCTSGQLGTLSRAMIEANILAHYAYQSSSGYSGPFEQLFSSGWGKGVTTSNDFMAIFFNMRAARDYPQKGTAGTRPGPANQLTIQCREKDGQNRCNDPKRKVFAYVNPANGVDGPRMTVCSRFFDTTSRGNPKALSTIEEGRKSNNYIDLLSQGHLILHEYMHVKTFGMKFQIDDIKDKLPSSNYRQVSIYGPSNCREYAHINGPGAPNINTIFNADNYAWWATGVYFTQLWNQPLQKRSLEIRDDDTQDNGDDPGLADDDFIADASTFTFEPVAPSNDTACHLDNSNQDQPKMICSDANEPTIAQSIGNGTDVTFADETLSA